MGATLEERNRVIEICARVGITMTEEQIEFASNITKPLVSFSNPGTGKSSTLTVGLLVAQTLHRIPGDKICAISFTKLATRELSVKYAQTCKLFNMTPTVNFNTLYSVCLSIVKEEFTTLRPKSGYDYETDLALLKEYMLQEGINVNHMSEVRKVLEAIDSLNSSLTFDRQNIEMSFKFKKLNIPVDAFQNIRREWFLRGLSEGSITQGDIPIYALYVLCRKPEVRKKYLKRFKVMVVDEFQDLSLLHLRILSLITTNLIAIGDIKQQIYAFNGACLQIVQEYMKIYPDARVVNLTQSFRCRDEIATFATSLIRGNDPTIEAFKGTKPGAEIKIIPSKQLSLSDIVAQVKAEQLRTISEDEVGKKQKSFMFLFRNNVSAIPLAEELYKQEVNFRMPKFMPIYEMPIFNDICKLAQAAAYPRNEEIVTKALRVFPEFKYNWKGLTAVLKLMSDLNMDLMDVPYPYKEMSSGQIIAAMSQARLCMDREDSAGKVFNSLLPVYEKYVIDYKWYIFPREKEYYFNLIKPIVNNKTYSRMYSDETEKLKIIRDSINGGFGVRCYTTHAAKGLEANHVWLLDADEGVFPNASMMQEYIEMGCEYEAAKELHNERNLLYVAATRAMDSLTICYDKEVSCLISNPDSNKYCFLDKVYAATRKDFDDIGAFNELFKIDNSIRRVSSLDEDISLQPRESRKIEIVSRAQAIIDEEKLAEL